MLLLKTLGGLSVERDGVPAIGAAQQRKPLALLALLAAAGRRGISRDKLTAYLWPESDTEHARNMLKQVCYALRRDLNAPELLLGTIEVRLNPEVITSDIGTFLEALERDDLNRAVAAYRGPFLDGFYLPGTVEFEHWVDETGAMLKRRAGDALESLANHAAAAGDLQLAVRSWRHLCEVHPLSGKAALGLVRALIAAQDLTAALEFGRSHESFVRQELGTAPDPAVRELLRQLRNEPDLTPGDAEAADGSSSAVAHSPVAANARRGAVSRLVGRRLLLAAGLGAVVIVAMVAGEWYRAPRDPHLLVVAPFEIFAGELEPRRDELAHRLSTNLDRVGPFRTVAPPLGHLAGSADRLSAERLARRTGAGLVLLGAFGRAGPDSVRLRASVLNLADHRTLAEFERVEHVDRIDRLADSLTVGVLRILLPTAAAHRRPFPRTSSLLALKAFLQGEWYLGRLWLDSAAASYERATALDSTFALAYSHLGVARSWNFQDGGEAVLRAAHVNRGLSRRDSLMIAYRTWSTGMHDPEFFRRVRKQEATLTELILHYPDDAEVWHEVGEVQFHLGFFWRDSTWRRARRSFDRAIALDSTFALPYIHAIEIALTDDDPDGALAYVRGYLAIPFVNREGAGMHLLSLLLEPDPAGARVFSANLEHAPLPALRRLAQAVRLWPDSAETQITVARRLVAAAESSVRGQDPQLAAYQLRFFQSLLANALVFRGHLREAGVMVGNRLAMTAFMQLAQLGAIPPESVEVVLARGVQDRDAGVHAAFPWMLEAPCYRTLEAALWWASRRDTARLQRLVRHEDSLVRTLAPDATRPFAAPVPGFARAALSLARGDTAAALRGFSLPDSLCPGEQQRRTMEFRLLAARGLNAGAAWVWERLYDHPVPLVLERARVAERLGEGDEAARYYAGVARAWRSADPELQPRVAEARAALARLRGEHRSP